MGELILLRHAKSDWGDPSLHDIERPLNERGREGAAAIGSWLFENGLIPEQVFCSVATRTAETLTRLGLGLEKDAGFTANLYHAEPEQILDVLAGASSARDMLVGHNPGIGHLAHALAHTSPDHLRFGDYPTCATCVIEFETDAWINVSPQSGNCIDFTVPRDLIGTSVDAID